MRSFRFLVALALLSCAGSAPAAVLDAPARARLEAGGRAHALVLDALEAAPKARVFLQLNLDAVGAPGLQKQTWKSRRPWVKAATAEVRRDLAGRGFEITHEFEGVSAVAGWIDVGGVDAALASPYVERVLPDSGGSAALLQSLPLANLSDTRAAGYTGQGVTVAVIDSGVDKTHPALAGKVVAEACFCTGGCCPNGSSEQHGSGAALDEHGHGTNVTGIIASGGQGGAPAGATPDVDIVAVRVLDAQGFFSTTADIVNALEWVVDWINDEEVPVASVNMSLATNLVYANNCDSAFAPFSQAVDAIRAEGGLPVAASGNNGSTTSMAAPACLDDVVSVAAVWDANVGTSPVFCQESTSADKITCFSNRNQYTDMLAPGAPVTSTGKGGGTSTYYGTSQASPMVAACAAAMRDANPNVSIAQMVSSMKGSPTKITDSATGRMFPRLDCLDAVLDVAPTTTSMPVEELCGDANKDGNVVASDALAVLQAAVGIAVACPIRRCDYDGSGTVTASDSLATLKRAVGQTVPHGCIAES